ncbi:MAG: tyrosine recombinase [bacterium]
MEEAIGLFLNHLALERNLRAASVAAYRQDLERLRDFLKSIKVKSPAAVKVGDITAYFGLLTDLGLAPSSIARQMSSLRGFFRFLIRDGLIDQNPTRHLQSPRIFRNLPEILSISEIEQILGAIDPESRFGKRDLAIIEMLYGSGLRISEVISLEVSHLFLEVEQIRVVGKGGRERIVPVSRPAKRAVNLYLEEERPAVARDSSRDVLFLSRFGRPFTRDGMFKLIGRRVSAGGISKHVSPHTFRHSFASHLVDGGASLRAVQEMLGHADITTTTIYTHVGQSYLKAVHREFHPRERRTVVDPGSR